MTDLERVVDLLKHAIFDAYREGFMAGSAGDESGYELRVARAESKASAYYDARKERFDQAIALLEAGKKPPSADAIHKMCNYLRASEDSDSPCENCPATYDTPYGEGQQICYGIALETLEKAREFEQPPPRNQGGGE